MPDGTVPPNLRLIGGEMPVWSDYAVGPSGRRPVGGDALVPLVGTARGRTLIAGPHDAALIDIVARRPEELVLLVRGVPDAEALAARYVDNPLVTVCCGGLEKLTAERPFETVVALDGLDRLSSVESADVAWGNAFGLLLAMLGSEGTLLLGVENFLGLHRLVALAPAYGEATDADWVVPSEYDETRPVGLAEVRSRIEDAGLRVTQLYSAYATPEAPSVLLTGEALAGVDGFLQATVGRAVAEGFAGQETLTDPRRLAVSALRHGTGAELAPAWLLLAHRAAGGARDLPAAVIATGGGRWELRKAADGTWTCRREGGPAAVTRGAREGATETGAEGGAATGAVPRGRTLEDLLIGACLRRDLPTVRELLGGWLAGPAAGAGADQVIVGADGSHTALGPADRPLAIVLGEFAATLVEGRLAHPWPATIDVERLALTLAAMTGRELDAAEVAGAARHLPDTGSYRELAAAKRQLAQHLDDAKAKLLWYEQMLTSRENSLKRAQRIIGLLSGSVPYRVGKALIGPVRTAKRSARAAVRRIKPRS